MNPLFINSSFICRSGFVFVCFGKEPDSYNLNILFLLISFLSGSFLYSSLWKWLILFLTSGLDIILLVVSLILFLFSSEGGLAFWVSLNFLLDSSLIGMPLFQAG